MKQVYETLLKFVTDKAPVLTSVKLHEDIPTIHEIGGEYRSSVNHIGFGCFVGKTPSGEFTFDGGGAMAKVEASDGKVIGYTALSGTKRVLEDLNYDIDKVITALKELING